MKNLSLSGSGVLLLIALVSWAEYQCFDTVEPWIRICGITLSWAVVAFGLWGALRRLAERPRAQ